MLVSVARRSVSLLLLLAAMGASVADELSLEVDYERSSMKIEAKAMGLIPAVLRFEEFTADVAVDEETRELREATVSFRIDSLTSPRGKRDRKVKDWLDADTYPEGGFELLRVEEEDGAPVAVGELTLHGQTREARFRYELGESGEGVALTAESTIDYREWGLPIMRILFFKVSPKLKISLELQGRLVAQDEG